MNFRLELLRSLVQRGFTYMPLHLIPIWETIAKLDALGVRFILIPMARTGTRPIEDLTTLVVLRRIFLEIRPDIVLPYTMKPIIYGGLARDCRVPRRFALVTGLGYIFIARAPSLKTSALRWLSVQLYRLALRGAERVFVYNQADAAKLAPMQSSTTTS